MRIAHALGTVALALMSWLATASVRGQELTKQEKADGFVSLFNGRNLDGWMQTGDSFAIEDGVVFTKPGKMGFLYSTKTYKDFILRYDVLITADTNSGVGIRCPERAKGHPANAGLEIQVLDNASPQFKNDPNRHASVCAVAYANNLEVPREEWHAAEVIAKGRLIEVKHNGKTAVNVDLSVAPMAKSHAGAQRTEGYIVLLNQRGRAEFKNIRIKVLP
jgi:hypothetical protein